MGGGTPRDEEYDQGGGGLCGRGRDVRKGSEKAEVEGEKEEEEAEKEEEEKEGGGTGMAVVGGDRGGGGVTLHIFMDNLHD